MPKPDRGLLSISETNITYRTDILHQHKQRLRAEARAATDDIATATVSEPKTSSLVTMSNLVPEASLSDPPEDPSIFLPTTFQSEMTPEEPTYVPDFAPSDSPRDEPLSLIETSPSDMTHMGRLLTNLKDNHW